MALLCLLLAPIGAASAADNASLGNGVPTGNSAPSVATASSKTPITAGDADLLVILGASDGGHGYGNVNWKEMTAALDAAAKSVTTTTDAEDLAFLLQFDALWLDQRWFTGFTDGQ